MKPPCSVDGCGNRVHGRGFCATHLYRLRMHGSLQLPAPKPWNPDEKFWPRVNKTDTCWEWMASRLQSGYGSVAVEGTVRRTHRVAYALAYGEIPEGFHLDHICRNRACVRPDHLRLATDKQNQENRDKSVKSDLPRGVSRTRSRYRARVIHYGREYNAGTFDTVEEADAAAIALRNELYTHNDSDRQKEKS